MGVAPLALERQSATMSAAFTLKEASLRVTNGIHAQADSNQKCTNARRLLCRQSSSESISCLCQRALDERASKRLEPIGNFVSKAG